MELTPNQIELISVNTITRLVIRPMSWHSKVGSALFTSQLTLKNLNRAKKNNYESN